MPLATTPKRFTMSHTALLSAEELLLECDSSWALLDCRFYLADPAAGEREYQENHLEGAHYAHLDRDLSGPITPGVTGRHPLPDGTGFRRTMGAWGIAPSTQVVAYDQGPGAFAARAWWLMRYHGHTLVAVLDGGLPAALEEGLALSLELPPTQTGQYPDLPPVALAAEAEEVFAGLAAGYEQHGPAGVGERPGRARVSEQRMLVDARANDRYRGLVEPLDPVAGHIPTAQNRPWQLNLADNGRFKSADELRQELSGFGPPEQQVHYCGSGVTAAHNLLAMEAAGLTGARLYPGSWSEWITDPARPVETEG